MEPTIVYKKGGKHRGPNGVSFTYRGVKSEADMKAALACGYFKTLDEALAPPKKKRAPKNVVD